MADEGFGSELWKNVQAIKFGPDGEIEVPVRADGQHGIVVGVDQVAASDAAPAAEPTRSSTTRLRRWLGRLTRR